MSIVSPATDTSPQARPFDATRAHVARIAAKREALLTAQLEAEQQLVWSIAREYNAGRLTLDELIDVYEDYRTTSGVIPGFSKRWSATVPVSAVELVAAKRKRETARAAPAEPDAGWLGPFPFGDEYVPNAGIFAVYVLFDSANRPCYVGSTGNVRHRLKCHHADGKAFTSWQARSCATRADAYTLERRWLAEYMPYLNKRAS